MRRPAAVLLIALVAAFGGATARAQDTDQPTPQATSTPAQTAAATGAAAPVAPATDTPDDLEVDPIQPDFNVITLPTTLRLPRHAFAFRVTHRFARSLGQGDFGDLAADFFGFDNGAQIGLELRFGLFTATQVGIHRTSDRTIQFFGARQILRQGPQPFGLELYATLEGLDNFKEQRSPGLSLVFSRTFRSRLAVYAMPGWVGNTNLEDFAGEDENTFVLGLASRLRLGHASALVGEALPRLGGYEHAGTHVSFGIERRVGGHNFQINFSRDLGTTLVQVARGGGALRRARASGATGSDPWYIGFNISRKFY